jgi:single-strand DNA-binding protein
MSRTLNKVQLIGHLGKDAEMRYTQSGAAVTNFTLATNRSVRQPDGSFAEETEWHAIVTWEKLAETANQFLRKGSKVYVEGRLQTRSWEQDGQTRYKTEIVAHELILLDPRPSGNGSEPTVPQRDWAPAGSGGEDDSLPF